MKKSIEVKWHELSSSYQPSDFSFKTTDDVPPIKGVIGQESATKALEFALKLASRGYNIYVSGEEGAGVFDHIKQMVTDVAQTKDIPDDLCYIYNFKNPAQPRAIFLQPGDGIQFRDDMKEFKQFLIDELATKLESYEADKKRQKLVNELEDKKEEVILELKEAAEKMGFSLELTKEGIVFIPITEEGEQLTQKEYDTLPKQERLRLKKVLAQLQEVAEEIVKTVKEMEKVYANYLEDLDEDIVIKEIGVYLKHLTERYGIYEHVSEYLEDLSQDILEHISLFITNESTEENGLKELFPWLGTKNSSEIVDKYEVNLMVDNSKLHSAPIISAHDVSYGDLVGKIKVDSELNGTKIDYNSILSGLFHKANGGYLVLKAQEVLENPGAWEAIKRLSKTGYIYTENLKTMSITSAINVSPEPVPAEIKVILVGPYKLYNLLKQVDLEFKDIFKFNVEFDSILDSDKEMIYHLACKIRYLCEEEHLPPVTTLGVLRLVEYNSRKVGTQNKVSADCGEIFNLIREAAVLTDKVITEKHIDEVLEIKDFIKQKVEKRTLENYDKQVILLDVEGRKVGQINGLAVYGIDEYTFGQPIKITATTYKGKAGVVDIEKASGLGGNIHTKGVEIIEGLLGYKFAQTTPLSLCCRLCVEQNYGGIDGDSASSAELYAILSSLAEVPIKQNLAVTGSINQYGQIQPIGGVNEKIEGFYNVCAKKGLTGSQGVIIPYQNTDDLMLSKEVVEAVRNHKFHIYQVQDYVEGIELLTSMSYDDISNRISKKLKLFNKEDRLKLLKKDKK